MSEATTTPELDRIADDAPRHTPLWALLSRWLLATEAWLRSHGGDPLRTTIRGFWLLIAFAGIGLLIGPVINKPLTLDDITSSASTATERWIARTIAIDYTIDLADDGTLVAQVEERFTAFFPDDVEATGIERVLATQYQGHDLAPRDITATVNGEPLELGRSETPTELTLTLDTGEQLQGDHDFVLRYTLHHLAYDTDDRSTGEPVQVLEWDVFGPSWPTGFAALEVRLDLPQQLDDRLVRAPRGGLAWTLLVASDWLEPEADSPAGRAVYTFTNEQNIPPHANAWFTVVLEPGSIVMPPRSPWFWVQTWGPLAPLALLLATLLLTLAARAVAWSDARGRPWYVAQSEPPPRVPVGIAAQVMGSRRGLELAEALEQHSHLRRRAAPDARLTSLERVGHAARRAGRLGDLPRALRRFFSAAERREQYVRGLRRVPHGFVRDAFVWAPISLTLVQWGLVRQLSHQVALAVVWWPVAFVAASTAIAVLVLTLALTAHPLTRKGALVRQHLLGVKVFADRTSLFERATLRDPAMAHAALLADPRRAGEIITERVETELGSESDPHGWRTPDFVTAPRMLVRFSALLVVVGTVLVMALAPNPYERGQGYLGYGWDIRGALYTEVESFRAEAVLTRDGEGRAVIEVVETVDVVFEADAPLPPQVVRQWRSEVDGQSLDLSIDRVLLDGRPVSHVVQPDLDTLLVRTTMAEPLEGAHEFTVEYTLGSAAVAAEYGPAGEIVDRVRWAALLRGWKYEYGRESPPLEPFEIALSIDPVLLDTALRAGWITLDRESAEWSPDWQDDVVAFGHVDVLGDGDAAVETIGAGDVDGLLRHSLALGFAAERETYSWQLTVDDVGVMIDFAPGTFTGPDVGALRAVGFATIAPLIATLAAGLLALGVAALGVTTAVRRPTGEPEEGLPRDLLRWLAPALGLAAALLFLWTSFDIVGDHPHLPLLGLGVLSGIAGGWWALAAGWRGPRT